MSIVHPIAHAWLTTGGTGAQNYDEFADESEITSIIEANPLSALAVEMPHKAPDTLGRTFAAALPAAVDRLAAAKSAGAYALAEQVVVLYRIVGDDTATPAASLRSDATAYGMFCMVNTDQISTGAGEPGLVIRNEEVFVEKVRERVALAEATGHLLSPVLLLQTAHRGGSAAPDHGDELAAALAAACDAAGAPAASDMDNAGRTHEIWPLPPGPTADELRALAGGGELVVADGNHRSLAAQVGGLPRFLAVVTTSASVTIQPYHRLVTELPVPLDELAERVGAEPISGTPAFPPPAGVAYLYAAGGFRRVALPVDPAGPRPANLDHALVERVLLREALGLDPDDKRIVYVGGDYPVSWLCGEVDAGRADLAIMIAPVTTDDFVAVNLAREQMPRKSTWFTPKARAGLVLAELA